MTQETDKKDITIPTALANVPRGGGDIELEGQQQNINEVLGYTLGIRVKDYPESRWGEGDIFSVVERTIMTEHEVDIIAGPGGLIYQAEHGIGGDGLDFPVPEIGETVVGFLRAKRSQGGASSVMAENILTTWLARLRLEEERRLKDSSRMVGMGQ